MVKDKKLYEFNQVRIFFIIIFCSVVSLLFYVYMGLPRNVAIPDYEEIESQSAFDVENHNGKVVSFSGWFTVNGQDSSRQLKKEMVLSNEDSSYSYPVRYIDRPDVAGSFKDNQFWRAGFACQINGRFLKKGKYRLYMKYVYNNKNYVSDLKREIQVR